ncbi:MAG: VCBS repeat-containing protein, partial [Planctomycetaceae bacterium]
MTIDIGQAADVYSDPITGRYDPNAGWRVSAWVDWNQDGDWSDPGEQVASSSTDIYDQLAVEAIVPDNAKTGITYGRIRIGTEPNLSWGGGAVDGYVDDFQVYVAPTDTTNFAPDSNGFVGLFGADLGAPSGVSSGVLYGSRGAYLDVNGDDVADILPVEYGGSVILVGANGVGQRRNTIADVAQISGRMRFGDINGDGVTDIVESGDSNSPGTWAVSSFNTSNIVSGNWGTISGTDPRYWGRDFGVVDYNGDGRDDLLTRVDSSTIQWMAGNTDKSLSNPQPTDAVLTEIPFRQFDFNGDNRIDLLSGRAVYLRTSTGGFNKVSLPTGAYSDSSAPSHITDIDGDNIPEVVSRRGIYEWEGGGFVFRGSYSSSPSPFVTGDLNNDGREEIVVPSAAGVSVLYFDTFFNPTAVSFSDSELNMGVGRVAQHGTTAKWKVEDGSILDFIPVRADVTDLPAAGSRWETFTGALGLRVPPNAPPTLNTIADVTVVEDSGTHTITLTGITAGGGKSQKLRVTANSSNSGLIPHPSVTYNSPDSSGSLRFTPAIDDSGVATITVTVEDGGPDGDLNTSADNATFARTFDVTVNPINDVPTLNAINDLSINEDASEQTVNLSGIAAGG